MGIVTRPYAEQSGVYFNHGQDIFNVSKMSGTHIASYSVGTKGIFILFILSCHYNKRVSFQVNKPVFNHSHVFCPL
jgi:hypothetical protein